MMLLLPQRINELHPIQYYLILPILSEWVLGGKPIYNEEIVVLIRMQNFFTI